MQVLLENAPAKAIISRVTEAIPDSYFSLLLLLHASILREQSLPAGNSLV